MSADEIGKGVKHAQELDPIGTNVVLDENLMAIFPPGSKILEVSRAGASAWVKTVRIDIELHDGTLKSYFKKGAPGNRGREMMEGTFESEKLVHSFAPDNAPAPLGWGSYKSSNMHFYVCDFIDMADDLDLLHPASFGKALALLHNNSMGKSPNAQYGFHRTTHLAFVPNDNTWTTTWTEWFSIAMKKMLREEERSHGVDEELNELEPAMFEKVIPRLLRPMETGGNRIEPCVCHSDIWPGNVKPDVKTKEVMMFDSCAFWGHHESDLACCRAPRYQLGPAYVEEYFKIIPKSNPEEDFDDRLALYAMRYDLLHSALFPKKSEFRQTAMSEMRRLIAKYPGGFREQPEEKPKYGVETAKL